MIQLFNIIDITDYPLTSLSARILQTYVVATTPTSHTLSHNKELELPVQRGRKVSTVFRTALAKRYKPKPNTNQVHVTHVLEGRNNHYSSNGKECKTKHAAASFTTSNVILSALCPPIDMSKKTWGFLTLGMVATPSGSPAGVRQEHL